MFVVVYRWTVREGFHDQFQRGWTMRTEEIKKEMGGLGSRLHRSEDGSWIAYAHLVGTQEIEALRETSFSCRW